MSTERRHALLRSLPKTVSSSTKCSEWSLGARYQQEGFS